MYGVKPANIKIGHGSKFSIFVTLKQISIIIFKFYCTSSECMTSQGEKNIIFDLYPCMQTKTLRNNV